MNAGEVMSMYADVATFIQSCYTAEGAIGTALNAAATWQDVMAIDPLKEKYESFGWNAIAVDGHDVGALIAADEEVGLQGMEGVRPQHDVRLDEVDDG